MKEFESLESRTAFEGPRVQVVYDLLCENIDPPAGEHWDASCIVYL